MRKRCRKRIPPSVLGHMGKVRIFEFFQKIPPLRGVNLKKYFKVTHRDQGEDHAKFGWNSSSSLGSKSEQTDKETDRQASLLNIKMYSSNISFLWEIAKMTICYCASDHCNGAMGTGAAFLLTLAAIVSATANPYNKASY